MKIENFTLYENWKLKMIMMRYIKFYHVIIVIDHLVITFYGVIMVIDHLVITFYHVIMLIPSNIHQYAINAGCLGSSATFTQK